MNLLNYRAISIKYHYFFLFSSFDSKGYIKLRIKPSKKEGKPIMVNYYWFIANDLFDDRQFVLQLILLFAQLKTN